MKQALSHASIPWTSPMKVRAENRLVFQLVNAGQNEYNQPEKNEDSGQ